MINVIISFTVKQMEIGKAKKVISEFVASVMENEPDTLFYKSFQNNEQPEHFIHVMSFANEKAMEAHSVTEYCKDFVEKLYPLCRELPQSSIYNEIR